MEIEGPEAHGGESYHRTGAGIPLQANANQMLATLRGASTGDSPGKRPKAAGNPRIHK